MMLFVISPPPLKCVFKERVSSKAERSCFALDHRGLRRGLKKDE